MDTNIRLEPLCCRCNAKRLPHAYAFYMQIPPSTTPLQCRYYPPLKPQNKDSSQPLNPIHLRSSTRLRPRPLPSDRQPHRMSPPPIRPHIPQSSNVLPQLSPQIVFYLHVR